MEIDHFCPGVQPSNQETLRQAANSICDLLIPVVTSHKQTTFELGSLNHTKGGHKDLPGGIQHSKTFRRISCTLSISPK